MWPLIPLLLVGVFATAQTAGAGPSTRSAALEHRSWQFHDPDWTHLQQAIPNARRSGMNRIQLSHNVIMNAQQLWDGNDAAKRLDLVRKIIDLAHRNDLKVDLWTHELSGEPAGLAATKTPPEKIWQSVREKYDRLFRLLPEIDGLVLTFAETQVAVYKTAISPDPPAQRVARLIDVMSQACAAHGKLLIVRTFVYEPAELESMRQALHAVAERVGPRGNVVVMTKCVPHDWTPFYPYDPLLGDVAGLPQAVELDLGQEFTGQSSLLHCEVDYVSRVMAHARSRNVVGAVARVERLANHALLTPNEVNIHAFSRLCLDPSPDADQLWAEWAAARYGKDAAPHVVAALKNTFDITNLICFPLEQWITNHSVLPNWSYAIGHVRQRSNSKWISSPRQERLRDELLSPSPATLIRILNEKDLAKRLVDESMGQLAEARSHLAEADYAELKLHFARLAAAVQIAREHNLALFTTQMLIDPVARARLARDDAELFRQRVSEHLSALRRLAGMLESGELPPSILATPSALRAFAKETEAKLTPSPSGRGPG